MSLFVEVVQTTTKVYRTTSHVSTLTRKREGKGADEVVGVACYIEVCSVGCAP
jgi:hypothetical protein